MHLYKKDGSPYSNENVAKSAATRLHLVNYNIVKVEGGFVVDDLKVASEIKEQPEHKTETTIESAATEKVAEKDAEPDDIDVWINSEFVKPNDAFAIIDPYKDKRFVYKWANPKNDGGTRIESLIQQNWRIDDVMYKSVRHLSSYKDNGTSTGTQTIVRGHLLMRLPRKAAKQRNKTYIDKANAGLKTEQDRLSKDVKGVYGKVSVSH